MKNNIAWSLALGFTILALVVLGFFVVRPVLAQVVATSTELLLGTTTPTESVEAVSASTTEAAAARTSTSTTEVAVTGPSALPVPSVLGKSATSSAGTSSTPPPASTPAAESAPIDGLVEVQLECPMSYTAPLYDTPSGHLDEGYFLGEPAASTTGMTAAHEIGEQAWTVCHDDEGKTYEFKIPMEEYNSHKIRGTPKKSVMKPAAASSALSAEAPAASSKSTTTPAKSTTPDTPSPKVLGASTSTAETTAPPSNNTSPESAPTSTSPSDAQPPAKQSTSTPLE